MRSSIERVNRLLLFYLERELSESCFVVNNLRMFRKKSENFPRLECKDLVQARIHYLLLQKVGRVNDSERYHKYSIMN